MRCYIDVLVDRKIGWITVFNKMLNKWHFECGSISTLFKGYFLCVAVSILFVLIYVHHMSVWGPWSLEEGIVSSGTEGGVDVSYHEWANTESWSSVKAASVLPTNPPLLTFNFNSWEWEWNTYSWKINNWIYNDLVSSKETILGKKTMMDNGGHWYSSVKESLPSMHEVQYLISHRKSNHYL